MPSTNQNLEDAVLRHAIYVQRVAGGYVNQLIPFLEQARTDLEALIESNAYSEARRNVLLAQVNQIYSSATAKFSDAFLKNVDQFAIYESEFTGKMLRTYTTADIALPSEQALLMSVNSARMDAPVNNLTIPKILTSRDLSEAEKQQIIRKAGKNITIRQATEQFITNRATAAQHSISDALLFNKTKQEAAKDLVGVLNVTKAQADALIRTSVNLTSNTARNAVYLENDDVIEYSEYVAKLDGRTTDICRSLDGSEYPIGQNPAGTLHWQCRSQAVARINQEFWK